MVTRRLPLLICVIAFSATIPAAVSAASAAPRSHRGRAPVRRSLPTITGRPDVGDLLRASPGRWSGARKLGYRWERCNAAAVHCRVMTGRGGHPYAARTYRLTASDVGRRIRLTVRATNAWGATSATSPATAVIKKAGAAGSTPAAHGQSPSSGSSPGPGGGGAIPSSGGGSAPSYFSTVASSENGSPPAGIPRADSTCAAQVRPTPENRPQNTTANHTVPSNPSSITWNPSMDYWKGFVADLNHVTGNFTGTTDEIFQWAACKWGIDEDIVRADAVVESDWVQSTVGNNCGVDGEASYGVLQVMNKDCSGDWIHGGWPYTQNDTALDADFWGADMRACFDGAFYNGGQWLYNGQTIAQVIAQHGQDYALWGCIGSWYSGGWYNSGAQGYIAAVQKDFQSKPWLKPGF
jgi:hypothetical protein